MTPHPLTPNVSQRVKIAQETQADCNMCWTCSSCDSECPVDLATGQLHPQRVVRMANLGLFDELLRLPEIWYCLTCRRCDEVCPNRVKPSQVVAFARHEALRQKIVPTAAYNDFRDLFARFQRVRWQATNQCLNGELASLDQDQWQEWLDTPVEMPDYGLRAGTESRRTTTSSVKLNGSAKAANIAACFTCSECSSACPLTFERAVFDPQAIIRMAVWGMTEELARSATIWLCIACKRCTAACTQRVQGHQIIQDLRQWASSSGLVDAGFTFRLDTAEKVIYNRLINQIDRIFHFK